MTNRTHSLAFALLALSMGGPALAVDRPSTYPGCASRSVSVPWGGSVSVDLKDCHSFGLGVVSLAPAHGTATPGASGPLDGYRYTHGGQAPAGGGRDRFVVLDDNSDTITVSVTVQPPSSAISLSPAALPALRTGQAARVGLSASGGAAPYTYRLAAGEPPPGLALSADGTLAGMPSARTVFAFEVAVSDANGASARRSFSGSIAPGPLSLSPASADVPRGAPYSLALAARGGVAPHRFQLEGRQRLPEGLRLSPAGLISGTTSAAPGRYLLSLRVTDGSDGDGDYFEIEPFVLRVVPPPALHGPGGP